MRLQKEMATNELIEQQNLQRIVMKQVPEQLDGKNRVTTETKYQTPVLPDRSINNASNQNTSSDEDVLQFDCEQLISSDCTNATNITK